MSLGWRGREQRHLRARPRATGLVRHRLAQGSWGASFRFCDNMTMIAPDAAGCKGHAAHKRHDHGAAQHPRKCDILLADFTDSLMESYYCPISDNRAPS